MLGLLLSTMIGVPLDYDFNYEQPVEQVQEQPYLEGKASWYDYKINGKRWTKTHDVCALRIYERYHHYKVCTEDKCIVCKQTDYWPQEYTNKVIDLSSHAFKQLAPLSRGVVDVKIYKLD